MSIIRRLWSEEDGQDIAEYAVMLAVILVLVIFSRYAFSPKPIPRSLVPRAVGTRKRSVLPRPRTCLVTAADTRAELQLLGSM